MESFDMPAKSAEAEERLLRCSSDLENVVTRPLFGQVGLSINGNLFAGTYGDSIGVKPGPEHVHALLAIPGTSSFGPDDRPTGGWVDLPVDMPEDAVREWVRVAYSYACELKPRQ